MNRLNRLEFWAGIGWGLVPLLIGAQTAPGLTFGDIWKKVQNEAPEIRSSEAQLKSARIAEDQAANHWFPRLYLDARAYETNDPAQSFMSVLEERQIATADFSPASLNQPLDQFYERGNLVLDFPLFEGGGKEALAETTGKIRESQEWARRAVRTQTYAQLAGQYASLLAAAEELSALEALKTQIQSILDHYTIGNKSNPVGYSGLLGLKNLMNRLAGLSAQNGSQTQTLRGQIALKAGNLPEGWAPSPMPVADFLTQTLPPPPDKQIPAYVQSALSRAVAAEKIKGAQTAALLPKVALFGQGSLENGNRATGTSYTAGAYLQWDLLDVPNWDRGAQADSDALAAQAGAESARQQSESEQIDAGETQKALQVNLELMDQSSRLLDEQTETARNLFKDGSINALQLVEVLSRRADLITARAQAERGLVQAHVSLAVNSGFQEPISER